MPQQLFLPNIKGLIPLIDRRKAAEPYVVDGQNFLMDANGPISGLGRTVISYKAIESLGNIQTFKISETLESFIVNNEGIFRFDTESGETVLLYPFSVPVQSEFPWSMAPVGNKYYFAREGSSLIEYDIVNDLWTTLTVGIPSNIYACTESDGRLILLTDLWVYWSAIGDGTDFAPSSSTGSGAQALTKLGLSNPKPLGIKTVADGFLTFLSSGIMKSHSIISTNPYRHTILSKQHRLVNPYCLTNDEDDNVIFLSKAGLYKTQGEKPTLWQPAMGEYFHSSVIPNLDVINNQNNIQIDFDYERSWFSIWIAESQVDYQYTKAFLLNTKIDQWGVLNTPFTALTNFYTLPSTFEGFIYGMIDNEGSVLRFDGSNGVEQIPLLQDGYSYYYLWEEIPARNIDDVITFTVHGEFSTTSKLNYTITGTYYKYNYLQSNISPEDLSSEVKSVKDVGMYTVEEATETSLFNDSFEDGTVDAWLNYPVGGTIDFPPNGEDGGLVLEVTKAVNLASSGLIPVNLDKLHRITAKVRLTTAPGDPFDASFNFYATCFSSTYTSLGESDILAYSLDLGAEPLGTWQTLTGYFFGYADGFPAPSDNPCDPIGIRYGTSYIRLNVQLNPFLVGTPPAAVVEIDEIKLDVLNYTCKTFRTNTTFAAGLTELAETRQDPDFQSLASYVTIGPVRVFNDEDVDRYSYINNITIGTLTGAAGDTSDDWNSTTKYPSDVIEDWNLLTGSEDWGFSASSSVDYDIELICTLDAVNPLPDYTPSISKINEDSSSDYYACETSGIYHLIKISALLDTQNYHIKTLDISANLGGRL